LASLEIPADIEEHTVIRESDLPRHFNNGKEIKPEQPGRTEDDRAAADEERLANDAGRRPPVQGPFGS